MAGNDGFSLEVYDEELGRYVLVPDTTPEPSKDLSVRKKSATQAKKPSASDYLGALKDVFVVDPRNSPAATLGGAAYDYVTKSTPKSVMRDIRGGAQGA